MGNENLKETQEQESDESHLSRELEHGENEVYFEQLKLNLPKVRKRASAMSEYTYLCSR